MTREALIQEINELPENFVLFLKSQTGTTVSNETLTTSPKKYRTADGFEGCIHISEDFDEPRGLK